MTKSIAVVAGFMLAMSTAVPAIASPAGPTDDINIRGDRSAGITRSNAVETADLDLADSADQAKLERRIRSAAARVCGPDNNVRIYSISGYKACVDGATASARTQIDTRLRSASVDTGSASGF